ncbi:MAG TPA: response regulator [Ruminiclostridium sp.]
MKVLIVDDEMIVRVGMKSIIDWQQHGLELVGEAVNGKEALDKIKEYSPDVVITDIKMPIMDGLILIEKAKELSKIPKFIVLSNYNEFDFVKEAMKLGAEDYILKYKMSSEQLLKILNTIRDKIEETSKNIEEKKQIEYQIRKNIPVMRRRFFNDVINNDDSISEEEFYRTRDFLRICFDLSSNCCMIIKIQDFHELKILDEKDIAMINISIINITEEIITDHFDGYCIDTRFGEFCIVLSIKKDITETYIKEKLNETKNRLIEMLYKYLNIRFNISLGLINHGIAGLRDSYQQAKENLNPEYDHVNDNYHLTILKAKDYIEKNYNKDLSTQDVADYVNLSRSYFSMLFSEHMNIGCSDYITRMRIEQAKNLLRNTDYKAYKIAEMVGYNNCHYLSRVFKKIVGLTPLEYRTKI